jgi:hypothetical protein
LWLPSRETGGVVLGDLLRLKDNISGRPFLVDTGEKMSEELSGCRFEWTFLLVKVNVAILGADFLKHFNLIVVLMAN